MYIIPALLLHSALPLSSSDECFRFIPAISNNYTKDIEYRILGDLDTEVTPDSGE